MLSLKNTMGRMDSDFLFNSIAAYANPAIMPIPTVSGSYPSSSLSIRITIFLSALFRRLSTLSSTS
ncbi:hypothetical protein FQZ97_693600 [compost metagenome]